MLKRKSLLLLFPSATVLAGCVVLFIEYWDYKKELADIETLFEAHVESVAALVTEGAEEAAASTSLIYEITEDHLATAAHLITDIDGSDEDVLSRLPAEHAIALSITADEDKSINGHWGPVPLEERAKFLDWARGIPEDILIEDGAARQFGLACLRYKETRRTKAARTKIICLDAERIAVMRREIGIGPLLSGIIKKDVIYVVLQDNEGILAAAPPDAEISKWRDDPFLDEVLRTRPQAGVTRLLPADNRTVFEGIVPFQMADESWVLLRVGIDALVLTKVQAQAKRRFIITLSLVLGVSLLTAILAGLLWARFRHAERIEQRLAVQEEERKHWETIGQMAATVAHEVRNPLNTMTMVSQRLKSEFSIQKAERKEYEEMLTLMMSEAKRVGRVVGEFLDLGKPLVLNSVDIPVRDAVDESILSMKLRAEKEQKNLSVFHGCDDEISIDKERFTQMLCNVIDNALDAVDREGRVDVKTSRDQNGVYISIKDDGPGMSQSRLLEVQKPFVSFKKTGTGLGLPLVKRIARAHRGALRLSSAENEGTKVEIFIPHPIGRR
jgi:signal transduction histidine kinase